MDLSPVYMTIQPVSEIKYSSRVRATISEQSPTSRGDRIE